MYRIEPQKNNRKLDTQAPTFTDLSVDVSAIVVAFVERFLFSV